MTGYHSVFISHAHKNNSICMEYYKALQEKGIDAWIDLQNMQDGHFLTQQIQTELQKRSAFILMMTPDSLESFWVGLERDAFLGLMAIHRNRALIPIRILPCDVPPFMNAFKWIDGIGATPEQIIDKVLRALEVENLPAETDKIPQTHQTLILNGASKAMCYSKQENMMKRWPPTILL